MPGQQYCSRRAQMTSCDRGCVYVSPITSPGRFPSCRALPARRAPSISRLGTIPPSARESLQRGPSTPNKSQEKHTEPRHTQNYHITRSGGDTATLISDTTRYLLIIGLVDGRFWDPYSPRSSSNQLKYTSTVTATIPQASNRRFLHARHLSKSG